MEQALEKKTFRRANIALEEAQIKAKMIYSLLTLFCLSCQEEGPTINLMNYFELFSSFADMAKGIIDNVEECSNEINDIGDCVGYVTAEEISKFADELSKKGRK